MADAVAGAGSYTDQREGRRGDARAAPRSHLQLCHNQWDAERGRSVTNVLHNLGWEDQLDPDAVERLIASLRRLLSPERQLAEADQAEALTWQSSARYGGTWMLDRLWRQLGLDATLRKLLKGRRLEFIVCHNPEPAARDAAIRDRLVTQLSERITGSDELTSTRRAELSGEPRTKPGLHRYLRLTTGGLLGVDQAAVNAEAKPDGKYLLRTSDPTLTPEDVARGYKQLAEVEAGCRQMKHILDLRPVYHWLEDRMRARDPVLARLVSHSHRRNPHP